MASVPATTTADAAAPALLFTPYTLRGVTFRNRLVLSPMCMFSSVDGFFNEFHLVHLGGKALGGFSLVFTEATSVSPEGRISPEDTGLWKDEHIAPLKRVFDFVKSTGAVAGIQLAHAGRKGSVPAPWRDDHHLKEGDGWEVLAPSPVSFGSETRSNVPKELSVEEILEIGDKFTAAARRAVTAGAQVIEIHGAHGYLLHEFLSPLANKRSDNYGGSFENRTRFLLETVTKVKAAIPSEILLFVRLSTTDWHPEGWTIDDSVRLARLLKGLGVDLVDSSSGSVIPNYKDIPFAPGYQVPLADQIKREAEIPTGAVGRITGGKQAEEVLQGNKADLIFIGTEALRDPQFPFRAAKELEVRGSNTLPVQFGHWVNKL